MVKFEQATEDVEKFFDSIRNQTSIPHWVEFMVLSNSKQKKEVCKSVKSSDLVQKLSGGVNFAIIINEEIFDQLPDDMKKIAIEECLAGIGVNEEDVISLEKPDFNTYSGLLQKYGDKNIINLHESIKSLYTLQKQKEDEAKALKATKKPKGEFVEKYKP